VSGPGRGPKPGDARYVANPIIRGLAAGRANAIVSGKRVFRANRDLAKPTKMLVRTVKHV
jgi:hypothetical protein